MAKYGPITTQQAKNEARRARRRNRTLKPRSVPFSAGHLVVRCFITMQPIPAGHVSEAFKRRARTQRARTEAPRSAYTRSTPGRADWRGPMAAPVLKIRGFLSDRTVLAKLLYFNPSKLPTPEEVNTLSAIFGSKPPK